MLQQSAVGSTDWWGRLALSALLALGCGLASAQRAGAGEVVPGAHLKSGPPPLPELTPFQAPGAPKASEKPPAEADPPPGVAGTDMLLASVALAGFLALRLRSSR